MKNTMIYFDVDGTLRTNDTHLVPSSSLKALQQLKKNGYKIGIATGRSLSSLKKTGVMDIMDWDSYICNNGQLILNDKQEILEEHFIDSTIVHQCIAIAKEHNLPLVLKMKKRIITQEPNTHVIESSRFFNNEIPPVGTYHDEPVEAMIAYGPKGYDYLPFTQLEELYIMPGESTYCDITIKGLSKASAILKELKRLNKREYIAFGDSLNDEEMFKYATTSIAMGQGNQHLKEMASFVTKNIDDDGIYYACTSLKYI